ncbi:hypothetical protein C8J57DRAFT_1232936 [Mycena rebaudengoi]|nr:hypothetical protein C8J57DRAFT_1232936 [Mycena rebaudengoi]
MTPGCTLMCTHGVSVRGGERKSWRGVAAPGRAGRGGTAEERKKGERRRGEWKRGERAGGWVEDKRLEREREIGRRGGMLREGGENTAGSGGSTSPARRRRARPQHTGPRTPNSPDSDPTHGGITNGVTGSKRVTPFSALRTLHITLMRPHPPASCLLLRTPPMHELARHAHRGTGRGCGGLHDEVQVEGAQGGEVHGVDEFKVYWGRVSGATAWICSRMRTTLQSSKRLINASRGGEGSARIRVGVEGDVEEGEDGGGEGTEEGGRDVVDCEDVEALEDGCAQDCGGEARGDGVTCLRIARTVGRRLPCCIHRRQDGPPRRRDGGGGRHINDPVAWEPVSRSSAQDALDRMYAGSDPQFVSAAHRLHSHRLAPDAQYSALLTLGQTVYENDGPGDLYICFRFNPRILANVYGGRLPLTGLDTAD